MSTPSTLSNRHTHSFLPPAPLSLSPLKVACSPATTPSPPYFDPVMASLQPTPPGASTHQGQRGPPSAPSYLFSPPPPPPSFFLSFFLPSPWPRDPGPLGGAPSPTLLSLDHTLWLDEPEMAASQAMMRKPPPSFPLPLFSASGCHSSSFLPECAPPLPLLHAARDSPPPLPPLSGSRQAPSAQVVNTGGRGAGGEAVLSSPPHGPSPPPADEALLPALGRPRAGMGMWTSS